ncbi:MAG: histidine--tRNA ligase [Patescibacteria group bacterium]
MENISQKKVVITPKAVSGFPEWLPEEKILENRLLDIIRQYYERYGFSPIETPAVERQEVLTAKGGNEKEIYSLSRLRAEDGDVKELALHFDLTVPLARYVAQHYGELAFPFRRYQIQKVWRGERPQSGRFREFYQADIDIIGDGELTLLADAEIPSIIYQIFKTMNIGPFVIKVNNRKILQGYFEYLGVPKENWVDVINTVDDLEKVGTEQVLSRLASGEFNLTFQSAQQLLSFISVEFKSNSDKELHNLKDMQVNELFQTGVDELIEVVRGVRALGVPDENFSIDLKVARGLDYYTGTVYETILVQHPGIGSICSGGRYDDLASHFIAKKLPGVGISIGVTRLLSRLLKAGILSAGSATVAPVLVTAMDPSRRLEYLRFASMLREEGVNTEVYLENRRIGDQLKYANRKKFAIAIIAGEVEFLDDSVVVKNLRTGDQEKIPVSMFVQKVKSILKG